MNTLIAELKEFFALSQEACGLLEELDAYLVETEAYPDTQEEADILIKEEAEAMNAASEEYNEARFASNIKGELSAMVELVLSAAQYSLFSGKPEQFAKAYPRMAKRAEDLGKDLRDMCSEELLNAGKDTFH